MTVHQQVQEHRRRQRPSCIAVQHDSFKQPIQTGLQMGDIVCVHPRPVVVCLQKLAGNSRTKGIAILDCLLPHLGLSLHSCLQGEQQGTGLIN